jgi:flagellar basal-body rod modification protein FlgD
MTMPSVLYNNLPPAANTQLAPSSSSSDTSNNTLGPNSFITLLTAQLQAQDPLNPMDPSQMVDQLTQINSLQQLIQIQSDLQQVLSGTPAASQSSGAAAQATPATAQTKAV